MLGERGMGPDHSSVYRWVQTFTPELVGKFHGRKMPADFLLTAHRNRAAALRFLRKATGQNGASSLININKSGANRAGINAFNAESHGELPPVEIRRCKHLNNIVEQDH